MRRDNPGIPPDSPVLLLTVVEKVPVTPKVTCVAGNCVVFQLFACNHEVEYKPLLLVDPTDIEIISLNDEVEET